MRVCAKRVPIEQAILPSFGMRPGAHPYSRFDTAAWRHAGGREHNAHRAPYRRRCREDAEIDAGVDRQLAEFVGAVNAEMAEWVPKTAPKRAFIGTLENAGRSSINITSHLTGGYLILELEPKVGPEKSSA